jgi:hypothetical protein
LLVLIGAFETEISFLLSDRQQRICSRTERAFAHLQRTIEVDHSFASNWQTAFKVRENACERLGAVHLLLHGIWAFKLDAAGARTDLVFQEPTEDLSHEQRYADGLVLTEWKTASSQNKVASKFREAREQAAKYVRGALGGNELRAYRYAVAVT